MSLIPCMGGWCKSRDNCAHYHAPTWGVRPHDQRLCGEVDDPEPLRAWVPVRRVVPVKVNSEPILEFFR